jgi:hypothetical protein
VDRDEELMCDDLVEDGVVIELKLARACAGRREERQGDEEFVNRAGLESLRALQLDAVELNGPGLVRESSYVEMSEEILFKVRLPARQVGLGIGSDGMAKGEFEFRERDVERHLDAGVVDIEQSEGVGLRVGERERRG